MRRPSVQRDPIGFDSVMAPMIDIVFQLLIFFICTANYATIEEILPSRFAATSGAAEAAIVDPRELDLERIALRGRLSGGRTVWSLNERPLGGPVEVRAQMAAIRGQMDAVGTPAASRAVVLDRDGEVPLGDGIDVYDVCRLEGFEKIQFAAKAE
ncbi:MAG: biopolymer transporter ExbD [Pirellulales bacterium]